METDIETSGELALDGLLTGWEPGWHLDVPNSYYHHLAGFSNSRASAMRRTPAFCRWEMTHPPEKSKAHETFGAAIHCAVLEPERFDSAYAVDPESPKGGFPQGWRNTKDYKAQVAELRARGLESLKPDEMAACEMVRESIEVRGGAARDVARAISKTEVTGLWIDRGWGDLRCRIRPDALCSNGIMVDLKTARSADRDAFERATYEYGYHRQRVLYMRGAEAIDPGAFEHFLFLVVESTPPFEFAVYDLDPSAVAMGERELDRLALDYGACLDSNVWPGYPSEVQTSGVPSYAYYKEELAEDDD